MNPERKFVGIFFLINVDSANDVRGATRRDSNGIRQYSSILLILALLTAGS